MKTEYPNIEETIQAYVLGRLAEDKKAEFEAYFLDKPEVIEQIELARKISILEYLPSVRPAGLPWQKLFGWLAVPLPAYATVAAVALAIVVTPSRYANTDIQLASFSTSVTRSQNQAAANQFDVMVDLSALPGNAAIMLKVPPKVKEYYRLHVFDASQSNSKPIWTSSLFSVKSGTRDQIISLPNRVKIPNATLRLYAKEENGHFSPTKFCHYTEVCL